MKPLRQNEIVSVITEMIEAIKHHDTIKKNELSQKYPWVNKWLHKRCYLIDLEEISNGDNFLIEVSRPISGIRSDYGLKPLLNIKISSSWGERWIRFEPIIGKKQIETFHMI